MSQKGSPVKLFLEENIADYTGQRLTIVPPNVHTGPLPRITELALDINDINKLENLTTYPSLRKLTASHNKIYRTHQLSSLKYLVHLDLSWNRITTMEGLKDMTFLKHLNLSHNMIKDMDFTISSPHLDYVDLSDNNISTICNMSKLTKLKTLLLHENQLSSLKHCGVYLPVSLTTLTLADNKISDLTEVSHLAGLAQLTELSIASNPCVQMTGSDVFDYRPYLINWNNGLEEIDGYAVDDIERLKGEWLFSLGRGRKFRPGQHSELVRYLVEQCPLRDETSETEKERMLQRILSKAEEHQSLMRTAEGPAQATDYSLTRSLRFEVRSSENIESACSIASTSALPVPESPLAIQEHAAIMIQKMWRGFHTRYLNTRVLKMYSEMHRRKNDALIQRLTEDVAATRAVMEGEHKLRLVQMQAINAQWRKAMKPPLPDLTDEIVKEMRNSIKQADIQVLRFPIASTVEILELRDSCERLTNQVEQLQICMQEVRRNIGPSSSTTIATQTDIDAVHQ